MVVKPRQLKDRITAWDQRICRNCNRTRVHYYVDRAWECIGTLPEDVRGPAQKCGPRERFLTNVS